MPDVSASSVSPSANMPVIAGAPVAASFTGYTVIDTVALSDSVSPSLTLNVNCANSS